MGGIFSPESSVSLHFFLSVCRAGLSHVVRLQHSSSPPFICIYSGFYGTLDLTVTYYGFCTGFRLGSVSLGAKVLNTLYSTRQLLITYRERSSCRSEHVHVSAHVVPVCQCVCVLHSPPYSRIAVLYELIAALH